MLMLEEDVYGWRVDGSLSLSLSLILIWQRGKRGSHYS